MSIIKFIFLPWHVNVSAVQQSYQRKDLISRNVWSPVKKAPKQVTTLWFTLFFLYYPAARTNGDTHSELVAGLRPPRVH